MKAWISGTGFLFSPDMGLLRSVFSKLNNTLGGLVEVGFEYVTGECNDGGKLLRKRKQNHYRFAVSSGNSPKVAGVSTYIQGGDVSRKNPHFLFRRAY